MSEKKFKGRVETILDHNVTREEFEKLSYGKKFDEKGILDYINETYYEYMGYDDISELYRMRGNESLASKYWRLSCQTSPKCIC